MKTINVSLTQHEDHSYPIFIKEGLFNEIADILSDKAFGSKYLIVTDSNVNSFYGKKLYDKLKKANIDIYIYSFPAGEQQKNIQTKINIETFMFEKQFGRDSAIIALGGGVVGDISGFTASTFNRGIPYIQVPTTILAQVDSSIGGKTAIDVPYGKNLIGTFYQPKLVLIDPEVLTTLPDTEYYSGIAEIIKHAVIQDKELFKLLENEIGTIKNRDMKILETVIERNCDIKRRVVELDEKEGNLRKILNYGHTIGHAIEKLMDYKMLHGECVAIGMSTEALISSYMGFLDEASVDNIQKLIRKFNLPTEIPKILSADEIFQATLLDKKAVKNEPYYSLPKSIGDMVILEGNYGVKVNRAIAVKSIEKLQ